MFLCGNTETLKKLDIVQIRTACLVSGTCHSEWHSKKLDFKILRRVERCFLKKMARCDLQRWEVPQSLSGVYFIVEKHPLHMSLVILCLDSPPSSPRWCMHFVARSHTATKSSNILNIDPELSWPLRVWVSGWKLLFAQQLKMCCHKWKCHVSKKKKKITAITNRQQTKQNICWVKCQPSYAASRFFSLIIGLLLANVSTAACRFLQKSDQQVISTTGSTSSRAVNSNLLEFSLQ